MQAVTYVAGPATVQEMLIVMPRSAAASPGVNFASAWPFPIAFVVSAAVGIAVVGPVQFRLVGNTFRKT